MSDRGISSIRIVSVYPTLLGTYGDGGNVRVLATRARARGYEVETTELAPGAPVPDQADLYVLGGGEDDAQVAAVRALRADGGLARAVGAGATVFAVCAGYQLLGERFPGSDGAPELGLELLDVTTARLPKRAVGELLAHPRADGLTQPLTGYENHAGATTLGPGARPLARVEEGVGNGTFGAGLTASGGAASGGAASGEASAAEASAAATEGAATEGAVQGRIVGTYLHGPGLARNPELADMLLGWVVGAPLPAWDAPEISALRAERLAAVRRR